MLKTTGGLALFAPSSYGVEEGAVGDLNKVSVRNYLITPKKAQFVRKRLTAVSGFGETTTFENERIYWSGTRATGEKGSAGAFCH